MKAIKKEQLEFLDWEMGAFFHFGIRTFYLNFRHYGIKGEEDAFFDGGLRTTQNGYVTELALQG